SSAPSVRSRSPVERLSTTTTSCPCSRRSRTTCDPMYPAPPITRVVMGRSYLARCARRHPGRRSAAPGAEAAGSSAPGARDRAPFGVAGRSLQTDHGPLAEALHAVRAGVGARGAHPGGYLVQQVLDPALALAEVHPRGGDALLEQALESTREGSFARGAVEEGAMGGHAEGLLVAAAVLVGAHLAGRHVGAREPGADHHVRGARGERERDVARMAHAAVGPDVPA